MVHVVVRPRPESLVEIDYNGQTVSVPVLLPPDKEKQEEDEKADDVDGGMNYPRRRPATTRANPSIRNTPTNKAYSVTTVLPPTTTQRELYQKVVQPLVCQSWLERGEHGAIFAYGFTGTGKSYSLFGTPHQPGVIVLSARDILERLVGISTTGNTAPAVADTAAAQLRVSIYEVDGKQIRDLLWGTTTKSSTSGVVLTNQEHNNLSHQDSCKRSHENKENSIQDDNTDLARLTARCDEQGRLHLRQQNGVGPLTRRIISSLDEFESLWNVAQGSRRVGSSTVHDASSRTHCICDLELVNDDICHMEEIIEHCHQAYVDASNAKDDIIKAKIKNIMEQDGGHYNPDSTIDGHPLQEVLQELGRPSETALTELHRARSVLTDYYQRDTTPPAYRGSFSFIDLAGNDWEQATTMQTKQAKLEHSHINTSLLAVKECFRAMNQKKTTTTTTVHIPYRRSVLTQILQRHFISKTTTIKSKNNNKTYKTNCVMLATIHPTSTEERAELTRKQTINTLMYASSISKI